MGLGLVHITVRVGYVWVLLNLAAITFFIALFSLQQAVRMVRRRRLEKSAHRAAVVSIARRQVRH